MLGALTFLNFNMIHCSYSTLCKRLCLHHSPNGQSDDYHVYSFLTPLVPLCHVFAVHVWVLFLLCPTSGANYNSLVLAPGFWKMAK